MVPSRSVPKRSLTLMLNLSPVAGRRPRGPVFTASLRLVCTAVEWQNHQWCSRWLVTSSGPAMRQCSATDERADADIVEFPGCFIHPSEMTGQHFAISHPETNELLPDGVVGEVRLSGLSVALGYYKLPELSAETFKRPLGVSKSDAQLLPGTTESGDQPLPASYLCTGDLGFIWERRLYIVGRLKDVLCIRGRTLHAHDVESCAEGAASDLRPGCTAAFPVSPDDGDEALVLIAELKPETATDSETLAHVVDQVVRGVLDGEGIKPHAVVLIKARSILKTTSGKLRRRELRNAYAQIDAMALAGELASGVAPHVHPATAPRSRAFGFLSSRVPEKPKPLIPADSVLFFWKEVGLTSRHAADATLAASGSASERAALSSRSEGALPDMQPSQQTNSDKNGREESPENSPVLDPLDDPKAASDAGRCAHRMPLRGVARSQIRTRPRTRARDAFQTTHPPP